MKHPVLRGFAVAALSTASWCATSVSSRSRAGARMNAAPATAAGAVSEFFHAARRMKPGDRESGHEEWMPIAERNEVTGVNGPF